MEVVVLNDGLFGIGQRIFKGGEEKTVAIGEEDVIGGCEMQGGGHNGQTDDLQGGVDLGEGIGDAFPEHLPDGCLEV